jgi:hypothetical protein
MLGGSERKQRAPQKMQYLVIPRGVALRGNPMGQVIPFPKPPRKPSEEEQVARLFELLGKLQKRPPKK